jgi:predicted ATPase/class 3 adenylate cyclase
MVNETESNLDERPLDRRKLIAVVYADIVGYSRLIGLDDIGTLQRFRALRANVIDPAIEEHGGRVVQTGGDSLLMAFDSIDGAMRYALTMQQRVPAIDGNQPPDRAIRFRVGIDIGDAIVDGMDLHGDAVNVVTRLQAECPPGGVCVSRSVRDHVHGRLDVSFEGLGQLRLKNIARPVEAFVVRLDAGSHPDSPPAGSPSAYHSNLPQLAHALIGRERALAEIEALLSRHRLVTLVGTAGVGKTSLSLQVGADLLARFPDGARFVELALLDQTELVGEAVAAAFGLPVHGQWQATDAVAAYLRSRRALVILDNCEHVIAAAAKLANALLKTCPDVFLLATSREALSVVGEHTYPVPLLDVPPRTKSLTAAQAIGHSAVDLFIERAAAALGRFSLTDETAPIVTEICRRLDGLPLAIELATPRLKVLQPQLLLKRLDDQLHLLTKGSRMAVPRQQTLRAALEWSYALLSEAEQAMLQRLGVFAGSFTLEAVAAVVGSAPAVAPDSFDVLAGLVEKSLVVSLAGTADGRYRLLESTRAFALEKLGLGGYAEHARRLCEHMTIVFERAERSWPTMATADWLAAYEPDLDNLRAALGWALRADGNPALGMHLVSHTDWLWRELGLLQEQQRWFELAFTFIGVTTPPSVEVRIRLALGWSLYGGDKGRLGHNIRAIELMRQADGEPSLLGQALTQAGTSTKGYQNIVEAEQYLNEALSVLRRCGRTKRLALALLNAGAGRKNAGELTVARTLIEEAMTLSAALGDVRVHDHCEAQLAMIAFAAGQIAQAIHCARRAVEASRRHGILIAELQAVHWLAAFLILDNQIQPGRAAALRAFELSRALGNLNLPGLLYQLALIRATRGETDAAARLAGFADVYAEQHQLGPDIAVAIRNRLVERLQDAMGLEECQAAMTAGAAWSEQEAVAVAEAA